jgi:hypothetical protein
VISNTGVISISVGGGLALTASTGAVQLTNSAIPAAGAGISVSFSGINAFISTSGEPPLDWRRAAGVPSSYFLAQK